MNGQTALLIIDMINDFQFDHGQRLAEQTNEIAQHIIAVKSYFKRQQYPVIYINDHYGLWQANFENIAKHCRNEKSNPIIDLIYPDEDDLFLIKPKHSAFFGTALNTLLYEKKIENLVLTGIAGNICVLFTANDAYMRGYQLHVPSNCIASTSEHDNTYALTMMKNVLKAKTSELNLTY
jgi:nicotinamidase-related amidase